MVEKGRPIEHITPSEAVDFASEEYKIHLSIPTVTKWAVQYGFGHQLGGKGGKWVINKTKFKNFLKGKQDE